MIREQLTIFHEQYYSVGHRLLNAGMSRENMVPDPLRELRVQRLCYCPHLLPLNNNGRVFCVPGKPFPIKEDCPDCPLRLEEDDIPSKLKGQIRRLGTPSDKPLRPSAQADADSKDEEP